MINVNGLLAIYGTENVAPLLENGLKSLHHRAWQGYQILSEDGEIYNDLESLKHLKSNCVVGSCLIKRLDEEMIRPFHGEIYDQEEAFYISKISDLASEGDASTISKLLDNVEGDYTFVYPTSDGLLIGRSPLGVKPLYIGYKSNRIGVSSEVKGIKSIGFQNIDSVRPGFIYMINFEREERYRIGQPFSEDPVDIELEEASQRISHLISRSVEKRVHGRRRLVLGFSGGLDSSLLAILFSRWAEVTLLPLYSKSSRDEVYTKQSAQELGLEVEECCVEEESIAQRMNFIKNLVEKDSLTDVSIAFVVNMISEKAMKMGFRNLILGQLADELFGGYSRYMKMYIQDGEAVVHKAIYNDVVNAYTANFERDDKAASPYVSLLLPYASTDLCRYVVRLKPRLKLSRAQNFRKLILRKVAVELGLPRRIAYSPKKAIQYSSGIYRLISRSIREKP